MTWLDHLLVWLAARVLALVQLRFSRQRARVWYVMGKAARPQRLSSGALTKKWCAISIGFGQPENVFNIYLERDQFEKLREGITDLMLEQDALYAQMED